MALVSYLRVSTKDQTVENQRMQIEKKGYKIDKEFSDSGFTGTTIDRKGFKKCTEYLREGDTLIIYSLSRLARNIKDLLSTIEDFEERKIELISISENIDTQTATGKLLIGIIAVMNQFEIDNLKERQAAGIERAKKEGKYAGRRKIKKPDNWGVVYGNWKCRNISAKEAIEQLGLKKTTFYRFVKEMQEGSLFKGF